MGTRVKTALAMAVVFLLVMAASSTVVLHIGVAAVSFIALGEMYSVVLKNRPVILRIPGLVFALIYPFASFVKQVDNPALVYALIVSLFIIQLKWVKNITLHDISVAFMFAYLITVTLSTVITIRHMEGGQYLIYLVFVIPWMSDTLAYLFGSQFGKKKLCPTISPNKTVVGGVFGMMGGAVTVFLFYLIMTYVIKQPILNLLPLVIVATFCSLLSEIGDLSASVVKRQCDAKDYGTIFPGHGGMMDRFDSVFFVAPVMFYFLTFFTIIS